MESQLNAKEEKLGKELRNVCDKSGKEKHPSESAKIFHSLGLVYKERSPDLICLIKSAALLNAAIARNPENISEIKQDLQTLCGHILHVAGAKQMDADLVKKSNNITEAVEEMRRKVDKSLEKVKHFSEEVNDENLKNLDSEKVTVIKQIQSGITSDYKLIMQSISDYCVHVMGEAPCKFAHVGMGSMARSEITPYSDFENVIILEEGCQYEADTYLNLILPFFRWFAVIFQVVLINLKETILPSVDITSLDWFFDAFTTRGVSFDGMMPHACKSPLGRQQPTNLKPFTTELIKPVSEMLKYLSTEQDLKNGYHLSDILTKTCFVYGNKAIYDQFSEGVKKTLNSCDTSILREQIRSQLKDDLDSFNPKTFLKVSQDHQSFNFKRIVYRSTTIFISALGRSYNILGNSCFEVLAGLQDKGVLSSYARRRLEYGVAVACEIRLRLYMKGKGQNDWIEKTSAESNINSLIVAVGKSSTIRYFQIAYSLQSDISHRLNIKKSHLYSDAYFINMAICSFLNLENEHKTLLNRCSKMNFKGSSKVRDFDTCLIELEMNLKEVESDLKDTEDGDPSEENKSEVYAKICEQLYEAEKFDEAVEFGEKFLKATTKVDCESAITLERSKLLFKIGNSLQELTEYIKARLYLMQCLQIQKQISSDEDTDRDVARTLRNISNCFMETHQHKEAMTYLQKSLKIYQKISSDEDTDRDVAGTLNNIGNCFMKTNQHQEAMTYLQKSLKIKQKISSDEDTDRNVAGTLHNIGNCFNKLHQNQEAMTYLQKSLKIKQKISSDEDTDRGVAHTLNNIGNCFMKTHQQKEAMTYLKKSLKIYQKISSDEDTDRDVARTLYNIGSAFMKTHQHKEAMTYLQKSLKIYQKISSDEDTDRDVAHTLNNIGLCFKKLDQNQEAMTYLQKSLKIYQKISSDEHTD